MTETAADVGLEVDKPWPCAVKEGHVSPCWALAEVLQSPGGRGTKQQGLEIQTMVNMTSLKFSRHLIVLKSGKHGKKGLVLNFCPYCQSELVEGSSAALTSAKGSASSRSTGES